MMDFRRIAVWCVLFALLAHAAGDVAVTPLKSPSVCDTQSLIAHMAQPAGPALASVCDLQRALKWPHRIPASSLPEGESVFQATLPQSFTLAYHGLQVLQAEQDSPTLAISGSIIADLSTGMSKHIHIPTCLRSHQIAPHAPPRLS